MEYSTGVVEASTWRQQNIHGIFHVIQAAAGGVPLLEIFFFCSGSGSLSRVTPPRFLAVRSFLDVSN